MRLPSGQIDSGLCRLGWPSAVGWTLNNYISTKISCGPERGDAVVRRWFQRAWILSCDGADSRYSRISR